MKWIFNNPHDYNPTLEDNPYVGLVAYIFLNRPDRPELKDKVFVYPYPLEFVDGEWHTVDGYVPFSTKSPYPVDHKHVVAWLPLESLSDFLEKDLMSCKKERVSISAE
jgi:hypothetical protein